jgi:hypothetical protein
MPSLLDVSPCPACRGSHVIFVEGAFSPVAWYAYVCPAPSEYVLVGDVSAARCAPGDIVPAGAIRAGRTDPPPRYDKW